MLPKRLKYYQAYDINFSNMADAYAKNLLINKTGIDGGCGSSSSCGSTTGSEWGDMALGIFNMAGSIATEAISASMMQKAAARNNAAAQTGASINSIAQAKAKVAGIEAQIKDVNSQLADVNAQLAKANGADAKIETLNNEIAALKQANGVTNDSPAEGSKLAEYKQAQSDLQTVNANIEKFGQLESNKNAAESALASTPSSFTFCGNKGGTITLNKDTGEPTKQIDRGNYETKVPDGKDEQGNPKYKTEFNEAAYQRDCQGLATCSQNYKAALAKNKQAADELARFVQTTGGKQKLESDKASLESTIADLKNSQTSQGSSMTVAQYEAKLADLENQKAEYQQAKDNKPNLEAKKTRLEKQLNGDNGLEAQLTKAKGELTSLQSSFSSIGSDAQNVLKEKSEYDAARDMGANGKKRTGFQKFFGLNRSAEHKKQRAEYREAARAYTQTTGMDATNAQYQEALRRAGLLKDS